MLFSLWAMLLVACTSKTYSEQAITPIRLSSNMHESWDLKLRSFIGFPTPDAFSVCHGLSCSNVSDVTLQQSQWQQVKTIFSPVADSARVERKQIQQAVALMEQLVGEQVGTTVDQAKNQLTDSRHGQLDCIDEATNTSVYLRLMETEGLLHWHQTAPRTSRGPLSGQAPHNTATIIELSSKQRYAVDAWFKSNGEPPAVVRLSDWQQGWRPEED
jgi:hypothetical protein